MADIYASDYGNKPLHMAAMGNAWTEDYSAVAAPAIADKLYLGIIPAGVRVYEVRLKSGAAGASATASLGYEPVDADGPSASAAYWLSGADVAAAGVDRSEASAITFNRPVKIVLTAAGANFASTAIEVIVTGKTVGAP